MRKAKNTRKHKSLRKNYKRKGEGKYYTKKDIFLSRMASILQVSKGDVRRMFNQRAVSAIRLNTLLGDANEIIKILEKVGVDLEKIPWSENAYFVRGMDKSDLAHLNAYKLGLFYIQNPASMIPALALMPTEKDLVLDMCAAPGSKTSHLAALMNNGGTIIANDIDNFRTAKLRNILDMFGVKNTEVKEMDGADIGYQEPGRYSKVLADVPCSGEGLIYMGGQNPLRNWSIKKAKSLTFTQQDLIESAYKALQPGGEMIYSTCTLEPIENEGVITKFLKRHPTAQIRHIELMESDNFKDHKKFMRRGIKHWNGMDFDPRVTKTYRIVPNKELMGFYLARIVKPE